jgi:hypothetical protein
LIAAVVPGLRVPIPDVRTGFPQLAWDSSNGLDDGINAVRNMMAVMYFDKVKCAEGIEALRQYRREFDENKRTFKPTPLHDWASHDADAMRYLCLGLEPEAAPVSVPKYEQGRRKWKGTISNLASWLTA